MAEIKKYRNFSGVIYPDSTSYDCETVKNNIKSRFKQWAFCLHDSDVNDDGELKKAHIHWVGAGDARTLVSCAKILGLAEHDIEICKNCKIMVRYLIHLDDSDKYQYLPSDIESNWKNLDIILRDESEGALCKDLCTAKTQMSWYDLIQYAIDTNSFDVLRRNLGLIDRVSQEWEKWHPVEEPRQPFPRYPFRGADGM